MSVTGSSIRVLHVDDDRDLCELAKVHLERANEDIEVSTTTSPEDGLERLEAEPIDCVVSDHDMPGMDGIEFLRAVRERDPELPFILFTGKGSEEVASEAISAGVTDYLQKGTSSDQYELLANRIEHGVDKVRTRDALAESERMFSTLVANLPGMVYRCRNERGWPMEFVSEGAKALTGYDAAAIESGAVDWGEEIIHEDDRSDMWDRVQLALDAGEPFEVTYRIRTADGDIRWLWERGRPVERDGDATTLVEGFITDVTARRTREEELEAERTFTRNVIDALEDMFLVLEPDGSIVRWNDRVPAVTGYDGGELAAKTLSEFCHPAAADRIEAAREQARTEGTATVEASLRTADGDAHPYEFRLAPVEHGDGVRLCAIGRNVRKTKQRQQELERYESIIQAVGDPMYTLDAEGRFTFVNDALASLTGYDATELIGEPIALLLSDEDRDRGREEIDGLLENDDRRFAIFEMDVRTADGEAIPCETHIALLPMPDGVFRGTAGVIRDITARKERERRLEEFASVVSHDLRNPLEVIASRVELARETGDLDHLDAVDRPLDRMHNLIADLLELAHRGEGVDELKRVELDRATEAAWQTIEADGATLEVAASTTVEADPGRLQALLENLLHNAVEHGRDGEHGTGSEYGTDGEYSEDGEYSGDGEYGTDGDGVADPSPLTVTVGATEDGFFVADDGVGIPEDERKTVFEHGYTTRPDGTGYGLAIVEDVVEAHGWSIRVTDSEDGGTRFEIEV